LSLRGLLLDDGIELVGGRVDLLACLVHLALSADLGLLVLLLRICAVGIELLLRPLRFRLGLVGLAVVSILPRVTSSRIGHTYCCALARTAS